MGSRRGAHCRHDDHHRTAAGGSPPRSPRGPGVEAGTGDRGEFGFRVGRREIGHLHGDRVLHIGFPKDVWQELFDAGRIGYHPVFPGKPGFGSRALATDADVEDAIALIRLNYERAVARRPAQMR